MNFTLVVEDAANALEG